MDDDVYDAIVVGAGVEGSATAYHLAKQHQRTLLIEQFPLPHSRGSSHGQTRVTRKAYEDDFYTAMMADAYQMMFQLEKEAGVKLYRKTGCLYIGLSDSGNLKKVESSLQKHGCVHEKISASEMKARFPGFAVSADMCAILDSEGGILRADKMISAFQTMFIRFGGQLHDGEPVESIQPGNIVTVKTSKGLYKTRNVAIAAGPWASKLLTPLGLSLPLKCKKILVMYWKEKTRGSYSVDENCPVFSYTPRHATAVIYGLPSDEYPGLVKVCLHHGPEIDPDLRDEVDVTWVEDTVREYVTKHMPGLEPVPSVVESCIYTNTPDSHFILDRHPRWSNILIAVGFSGSGFKISPVVGKAVCELIMKTTPSYDLSYFRINRFAPASRM
ncbi:peroxisomal sarcosine oxidase-like [Gigantopelta aegis]|uniref:peroxisomal sarcosine oxidase-like n=1 Tax=Gigantopelta aegis TaxID=1735272 RepID=UPI001B88E6E8|nr:peroxisomal sarcosine oxidase-like [Gigantopelta aegis]